VDALAVLTTVKSELLDLEKLRSRVRLSAGTPIVVMETGEARFCGRPAVGGDSLGRETGDTGTLGCLVANAAGERFILSCAHVIAATDKGRRNQINALEVRVPRRKKGEGVLSSLSSTA